MGRICSGPRNWQNGSGISVPIAARIPGPVSEIEGIESHVADGPTWVHRHWLDLAEVDRATGSKWPLIPSVGQGATHWADAG